MLFAAIAVVPGSVRVQGVGTKQVEEDEKKVCGDIEWTGTRMEVDVGGGVWSDACLSGCLGREAVRGSGGLDRGWPI